MKTPSGYQIIRKPSRRKDDDTPPMGISLEEISSVFEDETGAIAGVRRLLNVVLSGKALGFAVVVVTEDGIEPPVFKWKSNLAHIALEKGVEKLFSKIRKKEYEVSVELGSEWSEILLDD